MTSGREHDMGDMIDKIKNIDTEVPTWDVALASLAEEETEKLGRGLQLADIKRLATAHAIRFDDIIATLFELVLQGHWLYQDAQGELQTLSRDEVEKLYVGGRIAEADVEHYTGFWQPAATD
jgi:hypothetical protein